MKDAVQRVMWTSLQKHSLLVLFVGMLGFNCGGRPNLGRSSAFIEVEPLALDFGPVPVGLSANLSVEVRNLGSQSVSVEAARVEGGDFSGPSQRFVVEPGGHRFIDIVFAPTDVGSQSSVLHFVNDAENRPDVEIQVTGIGAPRLMCGDCLTPPPSYCANQTTLIMYERMGTCVANQCQYGSRTAVCESCNAGVCNSIADDGGMHADAGMDAGIEADAGTDAGIGGGDAGTQIYSTPGTYVFVVPPMCTELAVKAWGGGGAAGGQAKGGGGGFAQRSITVTEGQAVEVIVAGGGQRGTGGIGSAAGGAGGYGGGGKGGSAAATGTLTYINAGGGGGRSQVSIGSTVYLVAAGGGGGGGASRHAGGGGGATGLPAVGNGSSCSTSAMGGTPSAGGSGGTCGTSGTDGSSGLGGGGGRGASSGGAPGGGGGAGYFGGGGGGGGAAGQWGAGGAGGSSYAPGGITLAGTTATMLSSVVLAGNEADPDWAGDAGREGKDGLVVLRCR